MAYDHFDPDYELFKLGDVDRVDDALPRIGDAESDGKETEPLSQGEDALDFEFELLDGLHVHDAHADTRAFLEASEALDDGLQALTDSLFAVAQSAMSAASLVATPSAERFMLDLAGAAFEAFAVMQGLVLSLVTQQAVAQATQSGFSFLSAGPSQCDLDLGRARIAAATEAIAQGSPIMVLSSLIAGVAPNAYGAMASPVQTLSESLGDIIGLQVDALSRMGRAMA